MTEQKPVPKPEPPRPVVNLATIKVCPECAGPILRGSACVACAHCGWGRCE